VQIQVELLTMTAGMGSPTHLLLVAEVAGVQVYSVNGIDVLALVG
jgi:hypothetical protein